jgi:hypothetical protein
VRAVAGAVHRDRGSRRHYAAYPQAVRILRTLRDRNGSEGRDALKGRDDLRPDRNHPQKQCKRGEGSGFGNDSADHVFLPG